MDEDIKLNICCPHCRLPINLQSRLRRRRLLLAVVIQAERLGTEIVCHHCGMGFVYQRLVPAPGQVNRLRQRSSNPPQYRRAKRRIPPKRA